jgi:hypothetical protein
MDTRVSLCIANVFLSITHVSIRLDRHTCNMYRLNIHVLNMKPRAHARAHATQPLGTAVQHRACSRTVLDGESSERRTDEECLARPDSRESIGYG